MDFSTDIKIRGFHIDVFGHMIGDFRSMHKKNKQSLLNKFYDGVTRNVVPVSGVMRYRHILACIPQTMSSSRL